jgi:hypothetical protein
MTMESEYLIKEAPTCPQCKAVMEKMDARHLDWGTTFLWVCYNNDCGPFKKGWEHMMNTMGQLVSYRVMITPDTGTQGVIPAFSHEYLQKQGKPANPYLDPDAVDKYYEVPDDEE